MVKTHSQQIALAIVPKFTAFLSIFGSGWIITEVLYDRHKRATVYHRLMAMMAVYDILESIWNFMSTWPIPKGTENVYGASGTTQSCSAQGFFLQLGLAVPMYNAALSVYYVLVIRFAWDEQRVREKAERPMHIISFVFPFSTAVTCLALDQFNNANLWCWIAPLPMDCRGSGEGCTRGYNAWIYRWAFWFCPLWFIIIFATVCTVVMYLTVRKQDQETEKLRRQLHFSFNMPRRFTVFKQTSHRLFQDESLKSKDDSSKHSSRPPDDGERGQQPAEAEDEDQQLSAAQEEGEQSVEAQEEPQQPVEAQEEIQQPSEAQEEDQQPAGAQEEPQKPKSSLRRLFKRMENKEGEQGPSSPKARSQEAFRQAVWYLAAFYITHLFSSINRILQQTGVSPVFALALLHVFFDPLQGFLNFCVYRRIRYIRLRRRNPDLTRAQALKRAVRWSFLAPPSSSKQSTGLSSPPVIQEEDDSQDADSGDFVEPANPPEEFGRTAVVEDVPLDFTWDYTAEDQIRTDDNDNGDVNNDGDLGGGLLFFSDSVVGLVGATTSMDEAASEADSDQTGDKRAAFGPNV